MSMIGNTLLNKIIIEKEIFTPSEALGQLNREVTYSLNQSGQLMDDGMEISLICYDKIRHTITISQSNQRAVLIRKGGKLMVIEGGLFSIGGFLSNKKIPDYQDQVINAEEGMALYLVTDGFSDQLGGKEGLKFGQVQFEKLLLRSFTLPHEQQIKMLDSAHEEWREYNKQTDDILIACIRF
jgi:serine phosphatase RsbU (regulator of sigma subunit)